MPCGYHDLMNQPVCGAFAPIPTPVHDDGTLDEGALGRHLRWLAGQGLDGALILGTNGEFPSFSLADRRRAAEAAARADSGLQLLLGVGSCAVTEVEEMAAVAAGCGYAAVLCPPPFYFRSAPPDGLAEFFRRLLVVSRLPVLLYHVPKVTGVPIDDGLLDRLLGSSRLAGVKDSTGDPAEMVRLLGRFAGGCYLVGSDWLVSRCLEAGGNGSITAAASVVPALVASIRSQPDQQQSLDRVRGLLEEFGLGPAVKAILRRLGFGDYATRPPLMGLTRDREAELASRFEELAGAKLSPV